MRTRLLALVAVTSIGGGLALTVPAPAYAVAAADGYVWANQPSTASYIAATGYVYNSTGGDVEITRSSAGRYRVQFHGMGGSGGVAHVRRYGSGAGFCTVSSWSHDTDVNVYVRCFDTTGALADAMFVAHFTNRTVAGGNFAYFWANQPTAAGPYQPAAGYAYDSTGVPTQIQRQGVGDYVVYVNALSDLYPTDHNDGHLQVTAYNVNAVQCGMRVAADENPTPLAVRCFDASGNPADSRFTVSYSYGVGVLGTTPARGNAYVRNHFADPPYVDGWWNAGGEPTVTHVATGRYQVRFPLLATQFGYATVSSQEVNGDYCHVSSWNRNLVTLEQLVNVRCYDGVTDAATDQDFGVAFTT
jgi:hypothetical protein